MKTANELFDEAVAQIESKSIRAWATSDHNKPIWLKHIQSLLDEGRKVDTQRLCTFMILTAMG